MSTITAASGSDAWVGDDHPNRGYPGGNSIKLQASHRRGFVHVPVTDIRGRTVLSATLTGHVRSGFVAQTITVSAVTDSWAAGKVTWNRQPAIGSGVNTTLSTLSDGDAASLDVTSLLQSVANGAKWRGVRLSTNASTAEQSNWYAFDASKPAWTLTIELSDAPEQPSDLRPNIGSVASSAPILAWSYTDLGGDSSEQGGFRVQVDPAADETTPAFDTGWITSSEPQYDLSSGTFTPLSSGASTQWRVQTQDAAGNQSEWSDWAPFTFTPYPTLTMDSPTGGVIGDSTPDVLAHLTGETLTQWRVRILDASGDILWNSGLQDGAISITVPKKDDDGRRIIRRDDATYTIQVRAWGNVERADAVGFPAYVEQLVDVVFDEDAGVAVPSDFTVAQASVGDPRLTYSWFMSLEPDAILLLDDGEVVDRLDSSDWTVDAGTYTWTDLGVNDPYVPHTFTVRAVSSGQRSHASASDTITPLVQDVWLVPDDGLDPIRLETRDSIDQMTVTDRRATFSPLNSTTDVDIVYAFEGASLDSFTGLLGSRQNQGQAVSRLQSLREDVYARPRLVWGISIPVHLRNLKVLPASTYTRAEPVWNVSFGFIQAGD